MWWAPAAEMLPCRLRCVPSPLSWARLFFFRSVWMNFPRTPVLTTRGVGGVGRRAPVLGHVPPRGLRPLWPLPFPKKPSIGHRPQGLFSSLH